MITTGIRFCADNPRLLIAFRGSGVFFNNAVYFVYSEGAGGIRPVALLHADTGTRSNRLHTGQRRPVPGAGMYHLGKDRAIVFMNCFREFYPAGYVFIAIDAGVENIMRSQRPIENPALGYD